MACTCFASPPVYEHQLQNGLKVYVIEDKRTPIVLNSIWYRVGSSNEHNGITGISHMLEHMMFRGTHQHPPGQFDALVNKMGGEQNAITSHDHTVYYQISSKENLSKLMALEADRMRGLKLDPSLLNKEKLVVREERRMRTDDSPIALAQEQLWATAYKNNPTHHPVIGWASDINNYTLENVQRWHDDWYHPNNAFLLIIGDVNHQDVFKLAKQYFGKIPSKPLPQLKPRTDNSPASTTVQTLNIPSKNHFVLVSYSVPTFVTSKHPKEIEALTVLNQLMGVGSGSLLFNDFVFKKKIATTVQSIYSSPFMRHNGLLYTIILPVDDVSNHKVLSVFNNQINAIKNGKFSEADLSRAKNSLIASQTYELDQFDGTLHQYGLYPIANLPIQNQATTSKKIEAITRNNVIQAAKKYLTNDRKTIVIVNKKDKDLS